MPVVKLLQRGQLTLPKAVRDEAGIAEGDDLVIYVTGKGRVMLEALPRPAGLENLIGIVRPVKTLDVEDARRQAQIERVRRHMEKEKA